MQRAILRVREFRSKAKDSVEAFIEEAVVRRELADNFCFYNLENYDSIKGTNEWAQKTLHDHAQDKREYLYTREQLEGGKTHDDLWNAAQVCHWCIIFIWGMHTKYGLRYKLKYRLGFKTHNVDNLQLL